MTESHEKKQYSETEKLELCQKRIELKSVFLRPSKPVSVDELIELCHDADIEKLLKAHPEIFKPVVDTYGQPMDEWELAAPINHISKTIEWDKELSAFYETDENGRKRFVPVLLGEFLKKNYSFKTSNESEIIYVYVDGVYKDNGEIIIKNACRNILASQANTHRIKETIAHIQQTTYAKIENDDSVINVMNGLLNLKTKTLEPHDPSKFLLTQLPIYYVPEADCPAIKKFISEVLNPRDFQTFHEWAGYVLFDGYPFHRAVMLIGDGENGKSTLLELLKTFVGAENVANVPLQRFEKSPFAASNLEGKMLNIFADLSDVALVNTGVFKTLTGGDTISSEKKFVQKQTGFVNRAKLMFSCNKLPETLKDNSRAYFRRWIIWSFDNIFTGAKRDPHIIKKLTTREELSGLLNYALEGLERLLQQGEFSNIVKPEEMEEYYQRLSSPTYAFVMDLVDIDSESWVPKDDLYQAYVSYCKSQKLPPLANNSLSRELKRLGINIRDAKKVVAEKRVHVWEGIKLKGVQDVQDVHVFPLFKYNMCSDVVHNKDTKNVDNLDNMDKFAPKLSELPTNQEFHQDFLIKAGWTEAQIDHAVKLGLIFELRPGWYRRI